MEYKNYDKKIINNTSDFSLVIISNIQKMFYFKEELFETKPKEVYVDINSVLSILFRYDKLNDEYIINKITEIFEEFIDICIRACIKVRFLYSGKGSLVHTHIYPEWCKDRYERVSLSKSEFALKFLKAMKSFSTNNPNIEIVNTEDKHCAQVIYERMVESGDYSSLIYVVSKDLVTHSLLEHGNFIIISGVNYFCSKDPACQAYDIKSNDFSLDEVMFSKVYRILVGDSRNNYKGYPLIGPKKARKYIMDNRLKIFINGDHEHKEFIDKYYPLYDLTLMMEVYKTLKK